MADIFRVGQATQDEPEMAQPEHAGVIPKVNFRLLLSGPSKSGKTNLARWMLDKYYVKPGRKSWFDKIFLLSPTANIDPNWANLKGLDRKNRITDPTPQLLLKILGDQKKAIQGTASDGGVTMSSRALWKKKSNADKVLIIFDDAIAEKLVTTKQFLKIFIAGRHYGISSMVMTQSYMAVPRGVRLQATHVCLFPSRSTEVERLYTEHGPSRFMNKKDFTEMVQFATTPSDDSPYPFLYVDCFAKPEVRFRRNFTDTLAIDTGVAPMVAEEETKQEDPVSTQRRPRKRKR